MVFKQYRFVDISRAEWRRLEKKFKKDKYLNLIYDGSGIDEETGEKIIFLKFENIEIANILLKDFEQDLRESGLILN